MIGCGSNWNKLLVVFVGCGEQRSPFYYGIHSFATNFHCHLLSIFVEGDAPSGKVSKM